MTAHHYAVSTTWTGNLGSGTSGYRDYSRDVTVTAEGRPDLLGSADKAFRGDPERWNPEDLLVASLAQCHLLSFLHIAVNHGVVVTAYRDDASGTMEQRGIGGRFTEVVLRPQVELADPEHEPLLPQLHEEAHEACFVASSVAFPVRVEPVTS